MPSCFSRPPIRCSSPGVPGIAHGRARFSSREYGRNGSPSVDSVAKRGSISGSELTSGISHGSDEFARNVSVSRITGVR